MDEKEIQARLENAVTVITAMPCELRKMDIKSSIPEIVRSGDDWLAYNSPAAQDKLHASVRFRPTAQQIDDAMECMDWIRAIGASKSQSERRILVALIFIKSMGYGYRMTASMLLSKTGKNYSYGTCRNMFLAALLQMKKNI